MKANGSKENGKRKWVNRKAQVSKMDDTIKRLEHELRNQQTRVALLKELLAVAMK